MRRIVLTLALILIHGSVLAADPGQVATRLVEHLEAARMDDAEAMFTEQLSQALPTPALTKAWKSLGDFESRGIADVRQHEDLQVVVVPLQFSKDALNNQL